MTKRRRLPANNQPVSPEHIHITRRGLIGDTVEALIRDSVVNIPSPGEEMLDRRKGYINAQPWWFIATPENILPESESADETTGHNQE